MTSVSIFFIKKWFGEEIFNKEVEVVHLNVMQIEVLNEVLSSHISKQKYLPMTDGWTESQNIR